MLVALLLIVLALAIGVAHRYAHLPRCCWCGHRLVRGALVLAWPPLPLVAKQLRLFCPAEARGCVVEADPFDRCEAFALTSPDVWLSDTVAGVRPDESPIGSAARGARAGIDLGARR